MKPQVAIIAPGNMGAGVGRRLGQQGVDVLTVLEGRSRASRDRAEAAGMRAVSLDGLAEADMILSIVPPGEAVGLATSLLPRLSGRKGEALYIDCNAISPATAAVIGTVAERASVPFVDAGIIGGPPSDGANGPTFYASGKAATRFAALAAHGLTVKVLDASIGAASALKMSYAGITKGLTGIAAAMLLAASRAGVAEALRAELEESQAALLQRFNKALPAMYSKAYRWVAEMEEIAKFLDEDPAASQTFEGLAALYDRLAADFSGANTEIRRVDAFLEHKSRG